MEHDSVYTPFTHAPALIQGRHLWPPHVEAINPPSSRQVLARLSECLTPPLTATLPSKAQIRAGAYDSLGAHCQAEAQKPSQSLRWAYKACTEVIREHSKSFYFSARLLPNGKRAGVMALYAFCRLSDDLVDEADATGDTTARQDAARSLHRWAEQNRQATSESEHPIAAAWADTRLRHAIPAELPDDLIQGVSMDLTISRYDTWDDLWLYSYRVASTVGLMSMYITGAQTMHAVPYAVQLGVALQLTNILRDVGEDARVGRIYLPREDMERFGYTEDMLFSGVVNSQFIELMQFEAARANALYAASWPGVAMLAPDSRTAVAAASTIYRGILNKITATGHDVFNHRAYLTTSEKLRALPGIWWKARKT